MEGVTALSAPALLTGEHDLDGFDCGQESLDLWLKRRALRNQRSGASRTYAVCEDKRVVGYYALAAGAVLQADTPSHIRRNMPDPIPVAVLGRLAVDASWQGRGLGASLLADAVRRTLQAASTIGVRALVVHALSDRAMQFYERNGFRNSPTDPMDLMIGLEEAAKLLRLDSE